ncbi:hypothetical protein NBG4_90018 [Candidatus Sulfobium mesophilum]|uniref:Uncharacterized protein n=1 Tax=Candidatus Sulfobium mesophilum TaxID=2016548 RepID=A0A2U3QKY9_9BACT|nr:hypothetical protein NBG4_90018 [Candidatus Sulfobium mesophilum]
MLMDPPLVGDNYILGEPVMQLMRFGRPEIVTRRLMLSAICYSTKCSPRIMRRELSLESLAAGKTSINSVSEKNRNRQGGYY